MAEQRDFFGNGEVVGLRVGPVDQWNGDRVLADRFFHLHAVAQQAVDGFVVVVKTAVRVARFATKQIKRSRHLRLGVTATAKPGRQNVVLDIAVAFPFGPIIQIAVAELTAEQVDDAILGGAF